MAISVGTKAPDFRLKDKSGKIVTLGSMKAKHIVVYFYPKDDTSGCTLEAKGFNKQLAAFKKLGAVVIGISGGDEKSKAKFCSKYSLTLPLLSDSNFAVAKKWNSYGTKSFMGRKYTGILRKTFILDNKQRIIKIYDTVKPDSHPVEVLKFLKQSALSKTTVTKSSTARVKKVSVSLDKKKTAIKGSVRKLTVARSTRKPSTTVAKSTRKPAIKSAARKAQRSLPRKRPSSARK